MDTLRATDKNLALETLHATESAAIAAARWRGLGNKRAADRAATMAMRKALALAAIRGTVKIGEGEMDEATDEEMLWNGEKVGRWDERDPFVDIATDPLEGTNLCAKNGPGAITTLAFAEDGCFLNAPDMYMHKIAVGPVAKGAIKLSMGVTWNLHAIAEAKKVKTSDLTAVFLERDRHNAMIAEARVLGTHVQLISDGDLMAAIATADPESDIDVLFGIGGAPEGVLAAAALKSMGGDMQGLLAPESAEQAARAIAKTGRGIDHFYTIDEMAQGHVMFAATGVTDGAVFKGVRFMPDGSAVTHSMVTRSKTGSIRWIKKQVRADYVSAI
jgi:fructose-1,6-bisphosphatase II